VAVLGQGQALSLREWIPGPRSQSRTSFTGNTGFRISHFREDRRVRNDRPLHHLFMKLIPCSLLVVLSLLSASSGLFAEDYKGTIKIGGSGGALASMNEVAEAFKKEHPGVNIIFVPSLGSRGGIRAVLAGSIDLGLSCRSLKGDELQQGTTAVEYARTPFVFATTHKIDEVDFNLQQIASIYAGKMVKWPDGTPIRLILRPESDSDTRLLKSMSAEMNKAVQSALSRDGMIIAITDHESVDTIEKIYGAIGTSTLAQIVSEKRSLNILPLNGVIPSIKAIADRIYPYYKKFFIVTGPKSSPITKHFIEFINSPEGVKILTKTGHFVLPKK